MSCNICTYWTPESGCNHVERISLKEVGDKISALINQDGDRKTDGEVIDEIATYLNGLGLYTERILTDKEKEVVAFNTQKTKRKDLVIFFWTDKSGTGKSAQVSLRSILGSSLASEEENWDGTRLDKWAKKADISDVWENESESYRRIS